MKRQASRTTQTAVITILGVLVAAGALRGTPQDGTQSGSTTGLSSAPEASAAVVPRLVRFSGVLKDASGKPATGAVTVTFSLYELQEQGTPLWSETQNTPVDAQGRYTVLLGATQPDGLPLDLFSSNRARWLAVQPQLPAVGEQARVLLVGVPYALKAADADTLGGKPATAYVTTETLNAQGEAAAPAGEASTSAGPKAVRKNASSASTVTACAKVTADGTAAANFVAKFTSACVIHQSAIFESGGNVGIGNTSPGGTLDVSGNTVVRGALDLFQTTSPTVGVINMGASRFIHACCTASHPNTFVGLNAGNFTTTGNSNVASGFFALSSLTSGFSNTASGADALFSNTSGFNNTAVGLAALSLNTGGSHNTAIGDDALQHSLGGSGNTASGELSLVSNTQGNDNTAAGLSSLFSNTTGNFNSAFGNSADVSAGNLTNATAIGAFATVGESNALVLGCSPGTCLSGTTPPRVGIGTGVPAAALDVSAPNQVGLFVRGPFQGVGAGLDLQTTGAGSLQWEILDTGASAAQGPNKLNIRNVNTGKDVLTILANGEVGIGTTVPDTTLSVNGNADKPGGGSWGTFSDGRLKTVAGTYDAGLGAILKLTPVRYRYKEQNAMGIKDGQEHVGFVAQEVEKVIPEAVTRNSRGYLLLNNDPILWTMLNAIKQQQSQIEALTRSVQQKDAQIQKLALQAHELQKLQRQIAAVQARLARVEDKSDNGLTATLVVAP